MDQIKSRSAIEAEGRRAAKQRDHNNPYPFGSEAYVVWQRAWSGEMQKCVA